MTKKSKYFNKKVIVDGKKIDSRREARRHEELKMLEAAGLIDGLRVQVRYPFRIGGKLVCTYVADFVYNEKGSLVVEDSKNPYLAKHDRVFAIKRKLMLAIYNIEIKVTG